MEAANARNLRASASYSTLQDAIGFMVAPLPTPDPAHCMVLPVWLLKTNTLIPLTIIDKLLFDPALGGIVPNALHMPAGAVPPLG
jgi:hypothetical protein